MPPPHDSPSKELILRQVIEQQRTGKDEDTLEYTNVNEGTAISVINCLRESNENRSHR